MNPEMDENLLYAASSAMADVLEREVKIRAMRERAGPTDNEGLCEESVASLPLSHAMPGHLYFAMDAYTRILLLPYLAKAFSSSDYHEELAEDVLLAFAARLGKLVAYEMQEYVGAFTVEQPQLQSHKLIALPSEQYRKYRASYFLRDDAQPAYLGRCILFIALLKSG